MFKNIYKKKNLKVSALVIFYYAEEFNELPGREVFRGEYRFF